MEHEQRVVFLDTMRAFIVLLVIAVHAAVSYFPFPHWVQNRTLSASFFFVVEPLESCVLMSVLFFLAGYFAFPSLARRGAAELLKAKALRLGLPYLIGMVTLVPLLGLVYMLAQGVHLDFAGFLRQFYGPATFSQYHLWYLGVLLLFFLLLAFSSILRRRAPSVAGSGSGRPRLLLLGGFVLATTGLCFVLNLFFKSFDSPNLLEKWTRIYILQFETVRVPFYVGYFLLGMHAYRRCWFSSERRYRILPWASLYLGALGARLAQLLALFSGPASQIAKLGLHFTYSVEILALLMTLLGVFHRFFNRDGPAARFVARNSYGAYLVHLNLLFAVLALTRNLAIPLGIKFVLQTLAAAVLSWGASYLMRRSTAIRAFI